MYKTGDKLICKRNIYNMMDQPLFIKGETYTVLFNDTDNETVSLDHILYGNEYGEFDYDFVKKNFVFEF